MMRAYPTTESTLPWKHWSAERTGIALAILAAAGFSSKAIFVKLGYAYPVSAVTLLALRMAMSLPFFMWVAARSHAGAIRIGAGDAARLVVLGLLGYYGASILDFIGLQYISAGLERLILFVYPTLTVLIGVLFQGQRVGRREVGAIVLCYLGIAFAFAHDLSFSDNSRDIWIGGAFVFGSALSYALYLSGSASMITRLGSARFAALAMLVSSGATLLHFVIEQPLTALVQPLPVYVISLGMAVFSTVLPVFAQSAAIRQLGSGRAVLIGSLGPVMTIGLGWLVLNESISLAQIGGAAMVMGGVLLVGRARKPTP
jgi:drug/metabolite transporter (DMT)-like permease